MAEFEREPGRFSCQRVVLAHPETPLELLERAARLTYARSLNLGLGRHHPAECEVLLALALRAPAPRALAAWERFFSLSPLWAARELGRLPREVRSLFPRERVAEMLQHPDAEVRMAGILSLGQMGEGRAGEELPAPLPPREILPATRWNHRAGTRAHEAMAEQWGHLMHLPGAYLWAPGAEGFRIRCEPESPAARAWAEVVREGGTVVFLHEDYRVSIPILLEVARNQSRALSSWRRGRR